MEKMETTIKQKKYNNLAEGIDLSFYDAKKVLKKYRYTQTMLADKLGITQGALNGILNGNPSIAQVKAIADTIGCPFWEFFNFDKDLPENKKIKVKNKQDLTIRQENVTRCPICGASLSIVAR